LKEFAQQPLFHSSMLAIFTDPPAHKQVQLCYQKTGQANLSFIDF
jgi:hypothetical protein